MTNDTALDPTSDAAGTDVPDLTAYRAVHAAMRLSNEWLVSGIARTGRGDRRRIAAIRRWFAGYAGELRNHHHNEDHIMFPALAALVPAYAAFDEGLATDHLRLDAVIDGLDVSLRMWEQTPVSADRQATALELANELLDLLATHLDIEDEHVLPMFERHMTVEEYRRLDDEVVEHLDMRQALFTVPWLLTAVDAATATHLLTGAPVALRVLFRLTRGRYSRLARRAFA